MRSSCHSCEGRNPASENRFRHKAGMTKLTLIKQVYYTLPGRRRGKYYLASFFMIYIILSLIILLIVGSALWSPGGILLLDYIATDTQVIPWFQNAWYLIPQIPASILGYEWGTKLSFIFILALSAFLWVLIARRIGISLGMDPVQKRMIEILAGIFFLINPFAYERMMVQLVIYLGIILLGYAMYFLYFFERKDYTPLRALFVGSLMGLSLNLFLHASYMILLLLGVFILFLFEQREMWSS